MLEDHIYSSVVSALERKIQQEINKRWPVLLRKLQKRVLTETFLQKMVTEQLERAGRRVVERELRQVMVPYVVEQLKEEGVKKQLRATAYKLVRLYLETVEGNS